MYTFDSFDEFMLSLNRGDRCEINKDLFNYFLDILPPCFMNRGVILCDGSHIIADYGLREGEEVPKAFWRTPDGKFFAQKVKAK